MWVSHRLTSCTVVRFLIRARVLQRSSVASTPLSFVSLKFEIAFNLAVIWMIIFVALGKGQWLVAVRDKNENDERFPFKKGLFAK